jgi:hypothetical protein
LRGPGILVGVDETALNHKIKAHRGRAPRNKTDALCIVEVDEVITRVFACVIPDKKASMMVPIIVENVATGSKIWTDEHGLTHESTLWDMTMALFAINMNLLMEKQELIPRQ